MINGRHQLLIGLAVCAASLHSGTAHAQVTITKHTLTTDAKVFVATGFSADGRVLAGNDRRNNIVGRYFVVAPDSSGVYVDVANGRYSGNQNDVRMFIHSAALSLRLDGTTFRNLLVGSFDQFPTIRPPRGAPCGFRPL